MEPRAEGRCRTGMRTRMWMAAGACAMALAGAMASAGPAWAKGIESASITGPGLDHPLDATPPGDGGRLATLTGFWDVMPGQPRPPTFSEQAPPGTLGPRYTITWRLMTGPEETTAIRQDLYPDAAGGPLVHTAAGQPIFEGTTVGGWYAAPLGLRDVLGARGVPGAGARGLARRSGVPGCAGGRGGAGAGREGCGGVARPRRCRFERLSVGVRDHLGDRRAGARGRGRGGRRPPGPAPRAGGPDPALTQR